MFRYSYNRPTERKNTKIIAIGTINRIVKYQIVNSLFIFPNVPNANSVFNSLYGSRYPTKIEIKKAPRGIPILLAIKSAKSKMVFPKIRTLDQTPKDNALGIPKIRRKNFIGGDCILLCISTNNKFSNKDRCTDK